MSAFNNLIEQVALKEKLVKVQLKTDPAYSNLGTISKFQGYIGYILRENSTSSKVFLEQIGTVVIVPNGMIEPVQNKLSKVDLFKLAALRYLKEKRDIKQTDILTKLIINCNSIEYVESFCLDNGCTQDDIKNIYKLAFSSTINEATSPKKRSMLGHIARGAVKLAFGRAPSESLIPGKGKTSWENLKQPFKDAFGRPDAERKNATSAAAGYTIPANIQNIREEIRKRNLVNTPATSKFLNTIEQEVSNTSDRNKIQEFRKELADAQTASSNKITNSQLLACYFNAVY